MTEALKTAARDGDIKALEILLNNSFGPKNITVRVTNSASNLKIILRGSAPPDKDLAKLVKRGLRELQPKGFTKVFLTAEVIRQGTVWSEQWQLDSTKQTKPVASPVHPSPAPTESTQPEKERTKWYQQAWLVILLLVFIPLIGIPLVWVSPWSKRNKWTATAISGIWLCFVLFPNREQANQPLAEEPETESVIAASESEPEEPEVVDASFSDAVNKATAAATAAQSAGTYEDWNKTADLWTEAIALMKAVPDSNDNYQTAQQKTSEYQDNLNYAQERISALKPTVGVSKEEIKATFSQPEVGFTFEDSPLTDGTPRLLGKSSNGLAIMELYGSSDKLAKATLMTFVDNTVSSQNINLIALYNVAFLKKISPGHEWDSWIGKSAEELAVEGTGEKRVNAGDNVVSLSLTKVEGVFMFLLSIEPK